MEVGPCGEPLASRAYWSAGLARIGPFRAESDSRTVTVGSGKAGLETVTVGSVIDGNDLRRPMVGRATGEPIHDE